MILHIIHADSGRILVLGKQGGAAANDAVGYLPEERGLYRQMKVIDLLRFHSRLKGHMPGEGEIQHWLQRLQLADWGQRKVEALSKGMSQKVQFIATVIAKPQLLLLDEPFSGLDPINAEVLKEILSDLVRGGATVLLSTHDMAVAETLCDWILMIHKGRKVLDGTLRQIQEQHGSDVLRVRVDRPDSSPCQLGDVPGVAQVRHIGSMQELQLDGGTDRQQVLAQLMARGRVEHFEVARPSLRDIFLRIAGGNGS